MRLPAMSGSLQALGKLHAEGMAVGDLLVRRVDAADEGRGGQGRLQREALGGGQDELRRRIGQALAGRAKLAGWRNATSLPLRRQSKPSRPSSSRQSCRVRWLSNARRQVRGIAAVQRAAAAAKPAASATAPDQDAAAGAAHRCAAASRAPGPARRCRPMAPRSDRTTARHWRSWFQPARSRAHQGHVESFANQGVGRGQADHAGADDANPLSHDNRYPGVFRASTIGADDSGRTMNKDGQGINQVMGSRR